MRNRSQAVQHREQQGKQWDTAEDDRRDPCGNLLRCPEEQPEPKEESEHTVDSRDRQGTTSRCRQAERRHDNPCEDAAPIKPQASSPEGFEPASGHDDEDEVRTANHNHEDDAARTRRSGAATLGCYRYLSRNSWQVPCVTRSPTDHCGVGGGMDCSGSRPPALGAVGASGRFVSDRDERVIVEPHGRSAVLPRPVEATDAPRRSCSND